MPILSRGVLSALIYFSFLLYPQHVAAGSSIVINEIAWMGTSEGWQYEWIELYNNQNQETSIRGWQIDNAEVKGKTLMLPEENIIPAGGYFLICRKEAAGCDLTAGSLSLNNNYQDNGRLVLKDALGNVADQTPAPTGSSWPAGDNKTKQTMERKSSLSGEASLNWGSSQNPGGTPKNKNSVLSGSVDFNQSGKNASGAEETTVLTRFPSGILINEIMPSPSGPDAQEEWIEIFNQNSFEVDLSGWKISDFSGATTSYNFKESLIKGEEFLVLERPKTKIVLNNDGDGLALFQPNGNLVHRVSFGKSPQGQSYSRTTSSLSEVWVWSEKPSPGSINTLNSSKAPEENNEEKMVETQNATPSQEPFLNKAGLAAASQQIPEEKTGYFKPVLIALFLAVFSAALILTLKINLKRQERVTKD